MEFRNYEKQYDFVVVGGGFTGVVSALEAAQQGLHTALVTNRGFIGGNSGAEIRCPVDGADGEHQFNFQSRETGLIEKIRLQNLFQNPQGNSYRWDMVLMDFIAAEKNLDLYLNTCIDRTELDGKRIISVSGIQTTTEKRFTFRAPLFADNTGDGTVAALSGCGYASGSESKDTYAETIAPEHESDDHLLGTLTYYAADCGRKVEFCPPANAFDMEKSGLLEHREIPKEMFERFVWFYEVGAGMDEVADAEEINAEHRRLLYSIWDYIKHHDYGAENYDFTFISPYPGKRESRRIDGLYRLTEQDVTGQTEFEDAAGYGGWAIDLHSPKGFYGTDSENWWVYLKGVYQMPLRMAIAKDAENLFVVGRCCSVSHVALGSVRLNATLATLGQAVGTAAAICKEQGIGPHEFGAEQIRRLHQRQFLTDQTVIGYKNDDPADLALRAKVSASSLHPFSLDEPEEWFRLNTVLALSLPVTPEMKTLSVRYRAEADDTVTLRLFRSAKKQNYAPQIKILEKTFPVKKGAEGWLTADLADLKLEREFVFAELEGAETTELAATTKRLPCVCSVMRKENKLPNVRDYDTLSMMQYEWVKLGMPLKLRKYSTASQPNITHTLCFRTEPAVCVYGAENLNNGYLRPYAQPNLWVSAEGQQQWAELAWDEAITAGKLYLTFNSDLNFRIRNVKPYDFNVMPEIVRDFRVLAETKNGWQTVCEVHGNYQRHCVLDLGGIHTKKLRVETTATNGSEFVSLYNISVYEI